MGRSPCCEKSHTNKGAWSKEEDERLIAYIRTHGEGCWRSLPKSAGLQRCGKSCRLRWINYLRPDLKRGNFTEEEDNLIIKLHTFLGNKWALIAGRLPGRTDNEIKNYWNTHIKRKLMDQGIDPQTHRHVVSEKTNIVSKNCTSKSINFLVQELEPTAKMTDSVLDDGNCNSSTTVETQTMVLDRDMSSELLDLELSIGLGPFRSRLPKSSFDSDDLKPRTNHSKFYTKNYSNNNSNMLYKTNNNCGTFSFV